MPFISLKGKTKQEWLQLRKKGIGSTDVAGILGISQYTTPIKVYEEKRNPEIEQFSSPAMEWGLRLEEPIAKWYVESTKRKLQNPNKLFVSKTHPYLIASVDRLILPNGYDGKGILEIKTTMSYVQKSWEYEVPLEYYCQVQHQMYVTGFGYTEFAVLADGRYARVFRVERDDAYIERIIPSLVDFWENHVQAGVPPEKIALDYEEETPDPGSFLVASADVLSALTDLKKVSEEMAYLKKKKDALECEVKVCMGPFEILMHEGNPIATWKTTKPVERFDKDALKEKYPHIHAEFTKTGKPQRRFRALNITEE